MLAVAARPLLSLDGVPDRSKDGATAALGAIGLRNRDQDRRTGLGRLPQSIDEHGEIELDPLIEAIADGIAERLAECVLIFEHAAGNQPRMGRRDHRGGSNEVIERTGFEQDRFDLEAAVAMREPRVMADHGIAPALHHVGGQLDDVNFVGHGGGPCA